MSKRRVLRLEALWKLGRLRWLNDGLLLLVLLLLLLLRRLLVKWVLRFVLRLP
jgi:hypothetical protein